MIEPAPALFAVDPAAVGRPVSGWKKATVVEVEHPSSRAVKLRLRVPQRFEHLPGQHYVVRLTSEDGYRASRSYSVASEPADALIELYVERLEGGEVSGYLADVVQVGDELEVRGPIGGWFVWEATTPALAVGGGTGVVPLIAMLRHAISHGARDLLQLTASARTLADLPYADELIAAGATIVLSRQPRDGRPAGRLVAADVTAAVHAAGPDTMAFVCGSAGFAESASNLLVELGIPETTVRVERFGPTG